ncbi:MAG TPA: FAD:protein FMN transferase [Burkholderiaceae bacterium]|nr:FAD:protein FMN transferase [Burkholderiaceae bacterium]
MFSLFSSLQRPSRTAVAAPVWAPEPPGWQARDEAIMGTAIRVELWCDNASRGQAAIDAVMAEMRRVDRAMSPHKVDSELSRINGYAAREAVPLSPEMFALLQRAARFSELSEGAFDISYAAVGRLYDYRRGIAPSAARLDAARALVDWRGVVLDASACSVRFARPGMCIDLGGFAKGHAVDRATAILARMGIEHAHVAAGGDSRVIGDRRGRPWMIGIRDPRREDALVATLPLVDTAISTSGDYERSFVGADGVRHHHIVDPATGRSPDAVRSVTVLAADGLTCEALSKTVFVQGVERGLATIDKVPGADAIVVDADGRLVCSSGMLAGGTPARQHTPHPCQGGST